MYLCVYICMFAFVFMYLCIFVCVCRYGSMYVSVYDVCVYAHTYNESLNAYIDGQTGTFRVHRHY